MNIPRLSPSAGVGVALAITISLGLIIVSAFFFGCRSNGDTILFKVALEEASRCGLDTNRWFVRKRLADTSEYYVVLLERREITIGRRANALVFIEKVTGRAELRVSE